MDTPTTRSRFGLPLLVSLITIVAAFAGSASISDRGAAASVASSFHRKALAGAVADDAPAEAIVQLREAEGAPGVAPAGGGGVRKKVRCAGCGVVESVRRIERREIAAGVCSSADFDRRWITGDARTGGEDRGAATLADNVGSALETRPETRSTRVTSSYRLVIRFPDGSRQVFDEASFRTLQSGERIRVIAGADLPTE